VDRWIISADGINDSSQIVGRGHIDGGEDVRAFLLSPVPSTESTKPAGELILIDYVIGSPHNGHMVPSTPLRLYPHFRHGL
jgi:hypothetical protein